MPAADGVPGEVSQDPGQRIDPGGRKMLTQLSAPSPDAFSLLISNKAAINK